MATPFDVVRLDSAPSTQDEARARFGGRPMLVVAGVQTRGRGRRGAGWVSADRCVATSLAFATFWEHPVRSRISLVAGLAARDALGERVGLDWPNDVMIGGDKVAGILVEGSEDLVVVVGLGVNLWWAQPPPAGYGALFDEDPGEEATVRIATRWAASLLDRLAAGPDAWGREEYAATCSTLGRPLTWEPDGRGVARGIDPDGSLVVDTPDGEVRLDSGAVHTVRTWPTGTLGP